MTSTRKKYKYQIDNQMRAYGETDFEKKTIRINRKRHKSAKVDRISAKADGDEHLGMTIYHEELHRKNPSWTEKKVRKQEKSGWKKLSPAQKKSYYSKLTK